MPDDRIFKDKDGREYIDVTPTWVEVTRIAFAVFENGDAKGKAVMREELLKMAKIADAYVALKKAAKGAC